jgi:hypothetical protein
VARVRIRIYDQRPCTDKYPVPNGHALQCGDAATAYPDIISYLDNAFGSPSGQNDRLEYSY